MRVYVLSMLIQMQKKCVLKWSLFWYVITHFLLLLFYKILWSSIYANKTEIAGLSLKYLLGYYLLVIIIHQFTADRVDREIGRSIMNGSFVGELIRPVNLLWLKTAQKIGANLVGTVLLGIPVVVSAFFIIPLPMFHNQFSLLFFFLSLCLGLFIQLNINMLAGMTSFWVKGVEGVTHTKDFVAQIGSGALIPLAFLPPGIQKLFLFLPFRYIIDLPIQIYFQGSSALGVEVICLGLLWLIGLTLLNQFLFNKGVQRLTIYGG